MSFTSDWLFPPFQSQEMVDALIAEGKPVSYCNVQSDCGHDAFLLADDLPIYGEMMRAFLANLGRRRCRGDGRSPARLAADDDACCQRPDEHLPSPPAGLRFDRRS